MVLINSHLSGWDEMGRESGSGNTTLLGLGRECEESGKEPILSAPLHLCSRSNTESGRTVIGQEENEGNKRRHT